MSAMEETLKKKIDQSVRLIHSVASHRNVFLAFSGGKDSVVLNYLAKEANVKVQLIHNVTTIDPEGTLSFCQKHGASLLRPRFTFLELVEKKGMPTMFRRFCCKELKEQYIGDVGLFGVRRFESVKRSKCYDCASDIYYYTKKKYTERWFPILNFTDDDIRTIITEKSLECHPLYYDENGHFHVERRLGCIGCPLQGDRGRADFIRYPKLLAQILKRLVIFHENHGRTANDAYLNAVYNLFYSNHGHKKYQERFEGLFPDDPRDLLNSTFGLDLKD